MSCLLTGAEIHNKDAKAITLTPLYHIQRQICCGAEEADGLNRGQVQ